MFRKVSFSRLIPFPKHNYKDQYNVKMLLSDDVRIILQEHDR